MCRAAALAALAALALDGTALTAQDRASEERRLDSLRVTWMAAHRGVFQFEDSVKAIRLSYDSLHVSPFRLLVESGLGELARSAAQGGRAELLVSPETAVRELGRIRFTVRWNPADSSTVFVAALDSAGSEVHQRRAERGAAEVQHALVNTANELFVRHLDPQLRRWLDVGLRPDTLPTRFWTTLRFNLLVGGPLGQRCVDGDVTACAKALGLMPTADPLLEWLGPEHRRELVDINEWRARRVNSSATQGCLTGSDSACLVVLRQAGFPLRAAPSVRSSLAQLAVQLGGPSAFERLRGSHGTIAARMSATAGMPIDSLLGIWHARVRTAPARSDAITPGVAATSLLWIIVMGALSLRSSRWR